MWGEGLNTGGLILNVTGKQYEECSLDTGEMLLSGNHRGCHHRAQNEAPFSIACSDRLVLMKYCECVRFFLVILQSVICMYGQLEAIDKYQAPHLRKRVQPDPRA